VSFKNIGRMTDLSPRDNRTWRQLIRALSGLGTTIPLSLDGTTLSQSASGVKVSAATIATITAAQAAADTAQLEAESAIIRSAVGL